MVTRLLTYGAGLDAMDGVMYLRRRCSGSGVLCLLIGPPGSRLASAVRLAGRSFGVSHGLATGAFHGPAGFKFELAIFGKLSSLMTFLVRGCFTGSQICCYGFGE